MPDNLTFPVPEEFKRHAWMDEAACRREYARSLHIGNGWFGGFLPATAFAMVTATGDSYFGLWYPVVIALMTVVIGMFLVPETYKRDIFKA